LLTGFADIDRASSKVLAVHRINGSFGFLGRSEFDEPEAAGATRFAFAGDSDRDDIHALSLEERFKLGFIGVEGDIADIQLFIHWHRHRTRPFQTFYFKAGGGGKSIRLNRSGICRMTTSDR